MRIVAEDVAGVRDLRDDLVGNLGHPLEDRGVDLAGHGVGVVLHLRPGTRSDEDRGDGRLLRRPANRQMRQRTAALPRQFLQALDAGVDMRPHFGIEVDRVGPLVAFAELRLLRELAS